MAKQTWHTLQRVVLPAEADPEVLALYLDAANWGEIAGRSVRLSDESHVDDVLGRQKLRVRAGNDVSFASYFNAFPAAYWQRWTSIPTVRLSVRTSGPGTVLLYRSNARGIPQRQSTSSFSHSVSQYLIRGSTCGDFCSYMSESLR